MSAAHLVSVQCSAVLRTRAGRGGAWLDVDVNVDVAATLELVAVWFLPFLILL